MTPLLPPPRTINTRIRISLIATFAHSPFTFFTQIASARFKIFSEERKLYLTTILPSSSLWRFGDHLYKSQKEKTVLLHNDPFSISAHQDIFIVSQYILIKVGLVPSAAERWRAQETCPLSDEQWRSPELYDENNGKVQNRRRTEIELNFSLSLSLAARVQSIQNLLHYLLST